MTAADDERALSARTGVLLWGLVDWVELDRIHGYVAQENPGEPLAIVQGKTLELIRSLASDGLVEIGDLGGKDGRFVAWDITLDESIQRIRNVYVNNFDDENTWPWFSWLCLTEKGHQVAEVLSERVGFATPALTAEEVQAEQRRLAAAASLVDLVAGYVDGLNQLDADAVPEWLTQLGVPTGWQLAQLGDGSSVHPTRVVVCGPQDNGGWDASETLTLFSFTGTPPADVVYDNSDCTLRDLRAPLEDANTYLTPPTTEILATPAQSGVIAVRSSGFFVFCQRWLWAQYNTYIAGSELPAQGRMLQQCLYVDSTRRDALDADITCLADAVHQAFITTVDTLT